jgi:hypothetical protein
VQGYVVSWLDAARKWRFDGGKSRQDLPAWRLCGNIAPLERTGIGFSS